MCPEVESASENKYQIICGNKMPTRCNRWVFIADLIAQNVSDTIMPIIRSSRVLYK
jgi:hypothetical protein